MQRKGWPETGEFVVCTVKKVADFGAFVELDEYGKEGLIHISEVASGWVKYIRDHVREEQKIICKVLNVDPSKHHIDLSLKDVNEHQKREKIQEWKNEQKAGKWLEYIASQTGTKKEEMEKLADLLYEKLGSVYTAFKLAREKGADSLLELGVSREYAEMITRVAHENIKPPQVEISGYVKLTCPLPNGIEVIKKALEKGLAGDEEGVNVEISYVGAPKYRIKVTAPDYKKAENVLKTRAQEIIKFITKNKGTGEFHRKNGK